jgi:6-phosphogluconolactonase (cycloisomerase 2 family)
MRVLSRRWLSAALLGLMAAALGATAPAASARHHSSSSVVDHVYVNDNTTGTNTIAAFDRHADGSLTPEAGSPFTAGGAGTGSGLASQGALRVSPDGRFLIAVDAGSNQISVLRIRHDGTVALVHGGVVSSAGDTPVSVTISGNLVYVANAGSSGTNFTGFRLSRSGQLHPIAGSTVTLPSDAQPGDVLFNGDGTKLVGTLVGTSQIASYIVLDDGLLASAPDSPFTAQGLGPFGSEFRPTNPNQLFVSNAHNTAMNSGTVSAYQDSSNGNLTSIGSSPFADLQMAPCWVEISHDGKYLFAVNTASGSISSYSIAHDGSLTLLGSTPIKGTTTLGAVDARLSPDGRWLYVDESKTGAVATFAVRGGTLTELAGSPTSLPTGAAPAGVVVS